MRAAFGLVATNLVFVASLSAENDVNVPLVSLSDSLLPLRDEFNSNKDKFRVVALLSPT